MTVAHPAFKFVDLFAGIGGLRVGFESIGGQCVFTSEWNKFSQQTYRANFEDDHEINGDITKIHEVDIPEHDVLLAGFPCQPFSIAGVSKKNSLGRAHGFADETQGTLFFDVVRILRHHQPKAFLLENVKNLLSHDKGNTFRVIQHALDELGYDVDHKVIDASHWVPQHRERIFIVGFRRDVPTRFSLDDVIIPEGTGPLLKDILHPEDGTESAEEPFTVGKLAQVASKYTLTQNLWKYLQNYAAKHKAAGNGFGFGLNGPDGIARTLSARYYKDGSEILIRQGNGIPRRLTPRECARLMGFDRKGSNQPWKIVVSDTQAYRQFGNAVAAPVAIAIAEAMAPWITNTVALQPRRRKSA
ncbi:MAG: DNA (cytosine-5-)-methyltransferase [Rhodobacteraceae bacterium]|nr:DNA (cytosine-5-)-methyltransferase [Paracoccaceae bacterium]